MSLSVVVPHRERATTIQELGMASDEKDIPSPLDGTDPVGWWLGGPGGFIGEEVSRFADGQLGAVEPYGATGLTCLAVTADQRVLAILCPNGEGEQARESLWLSWALADLKITAEGERGMFKKRPRKIKLEIKSNEDELIMVNVGRFYRNSGIQNNQEASLAKALGV
jgi:hypothetical protein